MDWSSVQVWQIITNATLTVVGICVAIMSLVVAYRSNFGWPPIAILSSLEFKADPVTDDLFTAPPVVTFEVWNRRKYPITLRQITINGKSAKHLKPEEDGDHARILGPNESKRYTIQGLPLSRDAMIKKSVDGLMIRFFDPRLGKSESIQVSFYD
jgi:hypothetical protein